MRSSQRADCRAKLITLAVFTSHLQGISGAHIRKLRGNSIPAIIWVTGEWDSDSPEVQQIDHNINGASDDASLNASSAVFPPLTKSGKGILGQWRADLQFAKWAPVGTWIRYLTDEDMVESVRNVSRMLEDSDVGNLMTNTALHAFLNLRPAAYRADLWRYMILWAYGGVYLDANVRLERPLADWINFDDDKLVLVEDAGTPRCAYWNAMMAASPREPHLGKLIAAVANRIERHYYGPSALSITGPEAVCSIFKLEGAAQYKDFKTKYLRCELRKVGANGGHVVRGHGKEEAVMATKDEGLHHFLDPTKHYGPMWDTKTVYCDGLQEREGGWTGMCGS